MTIFQFADVTFDSQKCAIRNANGERRLRPKTARLLEFLIQRRGRVLTKEAIMDAVWAGDAISDGALYESVREARDALGDEARKPRFIRTYSKKGYEWVWPQVEIIGSAPGPAASGKDRAVQSAGSRRARRWLAIWLPAAALLLASIWAIHRAWRAPSHSNGAKRLAILPFHNLSGDANLKWVELGLRDLLVEELDSADFLVVAPLPETLKGVEALDGGRADDGMDPNDVQWLMQRLKADWLLDTEIDANGGAAHADARLYSREGRLQRIRESALEPLDLAAQLLPRLVQAVAPNLPEAAILAKVVDDPTPNNDYAKGVNALYTEGPKAAEPFFEAALRAMPDFHWARYELAICKQKRGRLDEARALLEKTLESVRGRGNLKLEAFAHMQLGKTEGFADKADTAAAHYQTAIMLFQQRHDQNMTAWCWLLLGRLAGEHDRFEQAESALDRAYQLYQEQSHRQGLGWAQEEMAILAHKRGEFAKARDLLERSLVIYRDIGALREASRSLRRLGRILHIEGLQSRGQRRFQEALALAKQAGDRQEICQTQLEQGEALAEAGQTGQARQLINEALALSEDNGFGQIAEKCRRALNELSETPKTR